MGVVSFQLGDIDSAGKYFLHALKSDSKNIDAAMYLSALPKMVDNLDGSIV